MVARAGSVAPRNIKVLPGRMRPRVLNVFREPHGLALRKACSRDVNIVVDQLRADAGVESATLGDLAACGAAGLAIRMPAVARTSRRVGFQKLNSKSS